MKTLKKNTQLILCILTLIQTSFIRGMEGNSAPQDPLRRLDYRDAFDQSKIYEKYKFLMEQWQCNKNVFEITNRSNAHDEEQDLPLLQEPYSDQREPLEKEHKDYEKECLKKLHAARRWAISEPARESLTLLLLMVAATGVINGLLDQESLGGSFSIFALIFNSVFLLRDTTRSAYQLAFQPAQPLDNLEEQFAKNQCFIPKALWPAIIEKFMLARQNQFEQSKCMDFIKFALGLTTFKPQKPLSVELNSREIIGALHKNIDAFFDDYEEAKNDQSSTVHNYRGFLKVNVAKFVLALLTKKPEVK
jgi:hypothetical protein